VGADPDHTVEWLAGYIREPKSVKENARMPPMQGKISDEEIQAVAEYLASLK
jgi:mono/diheme cytochrome c family protein